MSTPQMPHASPTPHIDVDTLADLQEGLLDPQRAAAVHAHVVDCAECRAVRDALDDVQILLRDGAAEDAAAPDDVVRRLDHALAAAVPAVAAASATVTPLAAAPSRARSPWRTRALQAAAVFVLVAAVGGIGYGGIRAMSGNDNSTASADSASGGSGKAGAQERSTAGAYKITSSGRNYTDASLRAAVPELLSGTLPAAKPPTALSSASPESAHPDAGDTAATASADPKRLLKGTALAACVANLADGPVTPLAVDLGRFEGKPATVIVLPDPTDPSYVNVYAVEPACPTGTFLSWQHVALP